MDEESATTRRHEKHFEKIFTTLDRCVKAPTFVISLVTICLLIAGSSGWILNKVFSDIQGNSRSIVELAIEQGRQAEKYEALRRTQDQTITQLIEALKDMQKGGGG